MSMLFQAVRWLRPALRIRTLRGEPILVGERQIIPVARLISFTLGRRGGPVAAGLVRNRPVAVLEVWRGETRRIPIPDVTRRILLALMASGLLLTLAARAVRRSRNHHERSIDL